MDALRARWNRLSVDGKRAAFVVACCAVVIHMIAVVLLVTATPNMLAALLIWDILIGSFAGLILIAKRIFPGGR